MSMAILFFPDVRPGRDCLARRLALAAAAAAALALLTGADGTIPAGVGKEPVKWAARSADMDYKTLVMHLHHDVKISQGEMSVAADDAEATITSKDSRNSHWVFTGNVHVRLESQGNLLADRATVEITNSALASADVSGSPAQFEQTRATSGRLVQGHAAAIHYDVAAAIVRLTGDAWLSDERNADEYMRSPTITYKMRERRIEDDSGGVAGRRNEMTITPKPEPGRTAHDSDATPGKP
jgi:lipopolysaccharide export system protein LptA